MSQPHPNGIAEALILGEKFINGDDVALILGDNIFVSDSLDIHATDKYRGSGAMIFTIEVSDPERYGVVQFEHGEPQLIVEKPKEHISNQAVTGLYFYDSKASSMARSLDFSSRGELEITDLNNLYLADNELDVFPLSSSSAWMDAGTFESLQQSSEFISALQGRSGQLFGSPETCAFKNGFIDRAKIDLILRTSPKNNYYHLLENSTIYNEFSSK